MKRMAEFSMILLMLVLILTGCAENETRTESEESIRQKKIMEQWEKAYKEAELIVVSIQGEGQLSSEMKKRVRKNLNVMLDNCPKVRQSETAIMKAEYGAGFFQKLTAYYAEEEEQEALRKSKVAVLTKNIGTYVWNVQIEYENSGTKKLDKEEKEISHQIKKFSRHKVRYTDEYLEELEKYYSKRKNNENR